MINVSLFIPDLAQIKRRRKPVRVVGIDLGTTNSSIVEIIWSPESPGSLQTTCAPVEQKLPGNGSEGHAGILVPSEIALLEGEVYVGQGARMLREQSLHNGLARNKHFFYECKNDIGIRKTYVARGAAFQALCLQLFGQGVMRPVCYDSIFLCVDSGTLELVPVGAGLPFPADGSPQRLNALAVPKTVLSGFLELKVELVAGSEKRSLYRALWCIPGPVSKGDPLYVEYCLNENQVLDISLVLEGSQEKFSAIIGSPLTSTVNPQARMVKILELEEDIRTGAVTGERVPEAMLEIGKHYSELGYKERAVHTLKQALKVKGGPDADILNRLGMYYEDMGDHERAEKFYCEAMSATTGPAPAFNLALYRWKRKLYDQADATIDATIAKSRQAPNFVLKALIASAQGDAQACTHNLQEAFLLFKPVHELSDWELGWYVTAADKSPDSSCAAAARAEREKRQSDNGDDFPESMLPVFRSALACTLDTTL